MRMFSQSQFTHLFPLLPLYFALHVFRTFLGLCLESCASDTMAHCVSLNHVTSLGMFLECFHGGQSHASASTLGGVTSNEPL